MRKKAKNTIAARNMESEYSTEDEEKMRGSTILAYSLPAENYVFQAMWHRKGNSVNINECGAVQIHANAYLHGVRECANVDDELLGVLSAGVIADLSRRLRNQPVQVRQEAY